LITDLIHWKTDLIHWINEHNELKDEVYNHQVITESSNMFLNFKIKSSIFLVLAVCTYSFFNGNDNIGEVINSCIPLSKEN
jgi:hypothetical protein